MHIALLHPTFWPEVRRGSERLIHDLGVSLGEAGHDVTLLTSHDGSTCSTDEDGIRVVRMRRPPRTLERAGFEYFLLGPLQSIPRLVRGQFDVAHSFSVADGWGASHARRLGGPPFVHSFHGIPGQSSMGSRRGRRSMVRLIVRRAGAVSVLSAAAAKPVRRYLGVEPLILPGAVRMSEFSVSVPRSLAPTLVCCASAEDPRKRIPLLLEAFAELRARHPEVRLVLCGGRVPAMVSARWAGTPGVEFVDPRGRETLPHLYASAWASVLPSVDEAFGLVLVESLAAGTPVVAARSGASPEIVNDSRIGRLFEPDDKASLASALEETLMLGAQATTAKACREEAAQHDWGWVVERYEAAYRSVAGL